VVCAHSSLPTEARALVGTVDVRRRPSVPAQQAERATKSGVIGPLLPAGGRHSKNPRRAGGGGGPPQ
jgi:hypothetical protein